MQEHRARRLLTSQYLEPTASQEIVEELQITLSNHIKSFDDCVGRSLYSDKVQTGS